MSVSSSWTPAGHARSLHLRGVRWRGARLLVLVLRPNLLLLNLVDGKRRLVVHLGGNLRDLRPLRVVLGGHGCSDEHKTETDDISPTLSAAAPRRR